MADIRVQSLQQPVDVSEYLFRRLHEIGDRSVHGVPGDYNLVALDYLSDCGLQWVGSVNELNAAYAADGYARVNRIEALITTFGVGELSAINGVAGAFSEHIPVVHIVGCPSTASKRNCMLLHHTLGNGDFNVFANMSAQISYAMAKLSSPSEIADQIDHALRQCWIQSRPVYITLPTDMVQAKIKGSRLKQPIDLAAPANDPEKEVDACAIRHRVLPEVHSLMDKSSLTMFVTPMGEGAIDEIHGNFGGGYAEAGSHPLEVKDRVESSDLIITIGALKSDFNTTGFSYRTLQLKSIDLHSDHCVVRYSTYPEVSMKGVLQKLSEFLKDDDIVVTETGTANFGIWDTKFSKRVTAFSQILWGSIGWSVGACQGAALAAMDNGADRRIILFVGDGSFQLTAQEVSTMIRHGLSPTMYVSCAPIHRKSLLVGCRDVNSATFLSYATKALPLRDFELYMPKKDAPRALMMTAEASAKTNAQTE
ncbi:hypothetical protein QQS21_001865 [Conoideocrella luteorostrata]|uniref:Pyruvate decarboxylase n=1 Tax=Conoideocrella luteorostrata TaxID=1105319 RepID=A0AAJ0G1L7_9HYPO|nr:hypothetical protein QQS21_001865 [Conoideocrella luteorostrata]